MWTFTPEDLCACVSVCVCVFAHRVVYTHTHTHTHTHRSSGSTLNSLALLSARHVVRLEKVEDTNTLQTHTHAFFHQRSSDDKTFPFARLRMKFFPTSSRRWWMWPSSRSALCVGSVFRGFLCALCLDCGLLLTSLWLQTHWHVIYGNEPWRKLGGINQMRPTRARLCVPLCVFGKKKESDGKRQDGNKKRHGGESVWDGWALSLVWCPLMQHATTKRL